MLGFIHLVQEGHVHEARVGGVEYGPVLSPPGPESEKSGAESCGATRLGMLVWCLDIS